MYETRQAALQHDENKLADVKGVAKATAGNCKAVNTRRALGDIGNLVAAGGRYNNADAQQAAKKALPQVERPITRSFGAQLANKKALAEAGVQNKEATAVEANAGRLRTGKVAVTTKERRGKTLTATLTAESEAACGQTPQKREELPNIDAGDVGNQLSVVEYVEDIYSFYRKTEAQSCVPPDYMSRQTNINQNMRAILVDWLIEVHLKFKLMPETLFLTTNLMDRYLASRTVERKNLQLVGMTAMLIASKYEEIWAPEIREFIYISDNAYTREQILNMEKTMLNTLRFNLCVPTPYMFMVRFLKAAGADAKLEMLAFYFLELCLVDYGMVKFTPSMLAATAVYMAQLTLKSKEECWSKLLKHHSGYTEQQLLECSRKIFSLHEKSRDGDLTVVSRKYSQEKFGSVALLTVPSL